MKRIAKLSGLFSVMCLLLWLPQKAESQYAHLPFSENFENPWINRDAICDVPSIYWRNTPPSGINSWHQANDAPGADASLYSACFNTLGNYEKGELDLYIDFSNNLTDKILNFKYFNIPETAQHTPKYFITSTLTVYLSVDGGINFEEISRQGPVNGWAKVVINLGKVTCSKGIIRFEGTNNTPALSNIYIDDVKIYNDTIKKDNLVTVFPSVTYGIINIKFKNIDNEKVTLYIINLKGSVLLSTNLYNETDIQLDLTGFADGIYYIRTDFKERSVTNMIIKN